MSRFHPDLRRAARLIPRISFGPRLVSLANWLQRRSGTPVPPTTDGVVIRDEFIVGPSNASLRVRLYVPADEVAARGAMLWMHGGGFVLGTPEQDEANCIELCRSLGLLIAAVDYRLAMTHPYPAPLEDCYAALRWLHANANGLSIANDRIAVGGNSAGAGLAAGLALLAHDRKEFPIAFQLLIYPMLDDRTTLRTGMDERYLRLWTIRSNMFGWRSYLGREPGGEDISDYAAPARRKDLAGLPPTWIGVGTCDLFHDEDFEYARRLSEAGVPCTCEIVEGAFHGFEIAGRDKEVVRNFRRSYFTALESWLGSNSS